MKHLPKKYVTICESLGWNVTEYPDENCVDLSQHSPAGEDFIFTVEIENFPEEVGAYYNGFDPEEHVAMWMDAKRSGTSGIPSIRELVKDADAIDSMLADLAFAVQDFE